MRWLKKTKNLSRLFLSFPLARIAAQNAADGQRDTGGRRQESTYFLREKQTCTNTNNLQIKFKFIHILYAVFFACCKSFLNRYYLQNDNLSM